MKLLSQFLRNELHLNPERYMNEFAVYEKLLLGWNEKINLISRKSDSIEEHILNSIFFLTKYKFHGNEVITDIGTGGGFPGVPLKILFPDLKILFVDSIQKKVKALSDIINEMKLIDTETVCGRAEQISRKPEFNKKFDHVITKAVGPLAKLYDWSNNFLNRKGEMLNIKGGDIKQELEELKKLKYNIRVEVINFDFPAEYKIEDKKLVIVRKTKR